MTNGRSIALWFGVIAATIAATPMVSRAGGENIHILARDNAAFALDLYDQLREENKGNIFFSPHSISAALSMTSAGADGETRTQMEKALRFSLEGMDVHKAFADLEARLNSVQESGDIALLSANSLWPQEGDIRKEYIAFVKKYYSAVVQDVNYKDEADREDARKRINGWVEERTQEKIKDLVPHGILNELTRLTLVNAVYFKGDWSSPFKEEATQDALFHLTPEAQVEVPLMRQKDRFGYAETNDLQILEMPYGDGALSMLIILPRDINGLAGLESNLDIQTIIQWRSQLIRKKVEVYLPKFKMSGQFSLNDYLKRLGMADAFNPQKANFAGMDGNPNRLYIAAALHKAFVEVNEAGTEAAAATAVVMAARSIAMPEETPVFRADHPFLFFIQENRTGAILFMGRVSDPAA